MADVAKHRVSEENNSGLACLACMDECILSCWVNIMEYVNQWAYVYVGVYSYPFRTNALINDDLKSNALYFGALGIGLVTCCVGHQMVRMEPMDWFSSNWGSRASVYGTMAVVGFMTYVCLNHEL
ncbi:hypothetical protein PsorP6_008789 [Peronosclerospora sorghi]|uniref:Uncharacterized protein n=1 Tax=Peronosclerospora sorghi TaxID=230839 RepID=A0ACC0VY16_9STRA|nr:hypothetical protein PsorP6_008789 [Peronosclerospora sorghi]